MAVQGFWRTKVMLSTLAIASLALTACPPPDDDGTTPEPEPLTGLADFHTHQFAHLAFGGSLHTHDINPSTPCRATLPYAEPDFQLVNLVRGGLFSEAKDQGEGVCYPTATNLAGQQMDTDSLYRAWRYGLRLMVVLAVNNEYLCQYADLAPDCPTDAQAIGIQLQAARDLENKIDEDNGGPGQGWYRIVTSSDEGRSVIEDGKLAVVLGVEAANAFGCRPGIRGEIPGVRTPIIGTGPTETAYQIDCGFPEPELAGIETPQALAYFEHYWDLGARHFFPIHNFDGIAGGTALSIPLLHAENNPSRMLSGGWLDRTPEIDRTIREVRPPILSNACPSISSFDSPPEVDPPEGRCNSQGLSDPGASLLRLMADYGAVIDMDHMSRIAKGNARSEMVLGDAYPFVSGHSGINPINHGDKRNEGQLSSHDIDANIRAGGAFAPILHTASTVNHEETFPADTTTARYDCGGTSEAYVQAYRYMVDSLEDGTLINGDPAFVGVGFGSDFNGLAGWPAPRFGELSVDTAGLGISDFIRAAFVGDPVETRAGYCYGAIGEPPTATFPATPAHVTYPFTSRLAENNESFDRSLLPWSGREARSGAEWQWDINFDGVAHVGMIPDFVEELSVLGGDQLDLDPLWHGAEAYLRMWDNSEAFEGDFTKEDGSTRHACRILRAGLLDVSDGASEDETWSATVANWSQVLADMREAHCHGT